MFKANKNAIIYRTTTNRFMAYCERDVLLDEGPFSKTYNVQIYYSLIHLTAKPSPAVASNPA